MPIDRLKSIVDMLIQAKKAHAEDKFAKGQALITDSIIFLNQYIRVEETKNDSTNNPSVDIINEIFGL